MKKILKETFTSKKGMEMVQVAILIAIAVAVGLLFRTEIKGFVEGTFSSLSKASFNG